MDIPHQILHHRGDYHGGRKAEHVLQKRVKSTLHQSARLARMIVLGRNSAYSNRLLTRGGLVGEDEKNFLRVRSTLEYLTVLLFDNTIDLSDYLDFPQPPQLESETEGLCHDEGFAKLPPHPQTL